MSQVDRSEILAALTDRLDGYRRSGGAPMGGGALRDGLENLVVLASSSRGGSSVVAEILRQTDHALHFRAEVNPFFVLAGFDPQRNGSGSDRLTGEDLRAEAQVARLLSEMSMDIGRAKTDLSDDPDLRDFGRDLVTRLSMQWPHVVFAEERVWDDARSTYRELVDRHGWAEGSFLDARLFHVLFLARIAERYPEVNPYYYDLGPELIARWTPHCKVPEGPPGPVIVEEPPFVCIRPWRSVTPAELGRMPVIMKTPSNVYRWEFLEGLFPSAQLRVFHLTRNAAASINGLVDGWRFNGFYSHRVDQPLRITGYSDQEDPLASDWWKFDVPPGWKDLVERPLVEVCAFQWRMAHEQTLRYAASSGVDVHRVRFEDMVGELVGREESFRRLTRWLGIDYDGRLAEVIREGLPPVMATDRPRSRRWYDRADLLGPVLETDGIGSMMEQLDYERDPQTWT